MLLCLQLSLRILAPVYAFPSRIPVSSYVVVENQQLASFLESKVTLKNITCGAFIYDAIHTMYKEHRYSHEYLNETHQYKKL